MLVEEFCITTTTPSATSIQVEWTYPAEEEGNVLIFSATTTYQGPCNMGMTPDHEREWTAPQRQRMVTIGDLEAFSEYSVIVKMIHIDNTTNAVVPTLPVVVSTLPTGKQH